MCQVESPQTRVASRVELIQALIKSSQVKSVVKLESSRIELVDQSLVKPSQRFLLGRVGNEF